MPNAMKYTNLGQSGLKVSRICVGCMGYGDKRGIEWCLEEDEALPVLDAAFKAGMNFFETANGYSNGASEEILGKAIRKFGWPREQIVIATKFGPFPVGKRTADEYDQTTFRGRGGPRITPEEWDQRGAVNQYGLGRKNVFHAVDRSLKQMGLEYIDLLQIGRFDPRTPIKETMKALHDVVESGKVRYIGACSMWAHQLLEMQYTARMNGWTEFISMSNLHNATYREEEREMIPSLQKFGMGMIPWCSVAAGFLTRPHEQVLETQRGGTMKGTFLGKPWTVTDKKINEKIAEIAKARGTTMAVVALAWSLSKPFVSAPIVGMSKVERVQEAVEAVNFALTKEEIEAIDALYEPKEVSGALA